jgi:hypothetical protein
VFKQVVEHGTALHEVPLNLLDLHPLADYPLLNLLLVCPLLEAAIDLILLDAKLDLFLFLQSLI